MLEHHEIKAIMKHRYPMLLVDRILSIENWEKVVGVKCITATDDCYAHVPDDAPLSSYAYPPSLIIESFGQACGVMIGLKRQQDGYQEGKLMIAAGVMGFTIHRDVYPGQTLVFDGRLVRELTDFAIFEGEATCENEKVATVDSMIVAFRTPDQF